MVRLLILSVDGGGHSQMAEGLVRALSTSADIEVTNVGIEAGKLDPRAVEVMAEIGIDISSQHIRTMADINSTAFDLVISLSARAAAHYPVLPGNPVVLSWELPEPGEDSRDASRDKLRAVRDEIKRRWEDFFTGGCLPALMALKRYSEAILDHLSDGVIAHDAKRHITWFNRAAERITGYSREEVIGSVCDQIFPGGFCGGKCLFSNNTPDFDNLHYPLNITARDGRQKRVEMSVVAMKNEKGEFQGVLASFHDVTEVTQLRRQLKNVQSFHGIIGSDDKMQMIYELISDLAVSDCPVLVQGESGTGKELIAGAIHGESRRSGRPFVTVNCGALPEGVLESELFGHVRGAFTGAIRDKKGRFELADEGTIFLDEVGELNPNMQVKLLRVLQEGTIDRVGDEKSVRLDVRVISATNHNLREMVQKGKFREDLYYRLCVVPVNLPPLRERRNDIPLLINHFIDRAGKDIDRPIKGITPEAMHCLIDYHWPGNIRELQNAIQYAFVKCKSEMLQIEHLPPEILSHAAKVRPVLSPRRGSKDQFAPAPRRGKLDLTRVEQALQKTNGNKVKAARLLGVGRATLYRFMNAQGLL